MRVRGVAAAGKQLANLTIRSPLDGVVAKRLANAGDVVAPGTELYHVIDPRSMQLEAAVPSEALSVIKAGLPVQFEVRGYPGQPFTGRIERISPAADPVTRQVSIFVTIPNVGGRLVCRPVRRRACLPAGPPRAGRAAHRREHLGPEGAMGAAGRGRQGGTRHGRGRTAR